MTWRATQATTPLRPGVGDDALFGDQGDDWLNSDQGNEERALGRYRPGMDQIVVGVDGSQASSYAVEWAAGEARRRQAALRIVSAAASWVLEPAPDPRAEEVRAWLRESGQELLDSAVARARSVAPEVGVSADLVPGPPARALLGAARDAVMVVVGTRGTGGLAGALVGSISLQVVSHAPVPAVAVRSAAQVPVGEVVVGVDGSPNSLAAVGFAFQEAALRQVRLRVVLAWTHPASTAPGELRPLAYDATVVEAREERTLVESLVGWREKFPDVEVAHEVVHERATRALAEASAQADLLVVGSRGRGGFAGLVLGSVSHAMLHHARCPIAVVPSQSRAAT